MLSTLIRRPASLGRAFAARLRRDERGVAAVEFAMIVPVMFMLFVGSIEFSQALTVDRRVTQSASATADLISRAPVDGLSTADVDGHLKIIEQLVQPYDTTKLLVKIYSVKAVSAGGGGVTYKVDWSRDNKGGTPAARNASYTDMPTGLLAAGESVIVSDTTYNYTPLIFKVFITSAFDLREKFYMKPRNSSCVHLKPINCVTGGNL